MPADPTDADREAAEDLLPWAPEDADGLAYRQARIAQALADERERARAPFLALADSWERYGVGNAYMRSAIRAAAGAPLPAAQEPTP